MEARKFTENELAKYDGENGAPAYIAYKGNVYDVSTSYLWRNGTHQMIHDAGIDLTSSLVRAPHGEESLEGFTVVGTLSPDDQSVSIPGI